VGDGFNVKVRARKGKKGTGQLSFCSGSPGKIAEMHLVVRRLPQRTVRLPGGREGEKKNP